MGRSVNLIVNSIKWNLPQNLMLDLHGWRVASCEKLWIWIKARTVHTGNSPRADCLKLYRGKKSLRMFDLLRFSSKYFLLVWYIVFLKVFFPCFFAKDLTNCQERVKEKLNLIPSQFRQGTSIIAKFSDHSCEISSFSDPLCGESSISKDQWSEISSSIYKIRFQQEVCHWGHTEISHWKHHYKRTWPVSSRERVSYLKLKETNCTIILLWEAEDYSIVRLIKNFTV